MATWFSVALSVTISFLKQYPPLSGGGSPCVARTFLSILQWSGRQTCEIKIHFSALGDGVKLSGYQPYKL